MDSPAGLPAGRARRRGRCVAISLLSLALWLPADAGAGSPVAGLGTFAATRQDTIYAGRTDQDNPVVVDVAAGKIKSVSIFWYATCSSGQRFDFGGPITTVASLPAIIADGQNVLLGARVAKSGRFKGRGLGSVDLGDSSGALSERMQGKLAANAAFGSFRAHIDMVDTRTGKDVDSCDTGNITWKAPVPQSLYYGGNSTQGEPVMLKLNRDRRRVNVFRIAWYAPCTSGSSLDYGDALTHFDMSPDGSFGDTFTQTYPDDSGGQAEYAYVLNGKVGRRSGSGSFHVVVSFKDAGGAVTDTCTSPAIHWSAQQ